MWRRTARRTLLLAWLVSLALVAWVGTHPRLLAPLVARLASRHFFPEREGSLRLRDFRGDLLHGMELHEVSVSLALPGGAVLAASVDTVILEYRLRELVGPAPRVRRVEALGAVVHATSGHDADGASGPEGAEPLRLPRLAVDAFAVRGTFEVVGPNGRLLDRASRLELRGTAALAGDSLAVVLREGRLDLESRQSRLEQARGRVRLGGGGLAIEDAYCLLNGRPVEARVAIAPGGDLDVTVQARDASAPEVGRLLDEDLDVDLRGDFTGHVRTRGDTVRIDAALDGRIEGYEVEGLRGWAVSVPGELVWERLQGRINGARFAGAGRFDLRDPYGVEFWLDGEVADVDLARGLVPGAQLPPTGGHGRLRLHRREAADETEVTGWLADGFVADIPFDTCRVRVTAARGVATLAPVTLRYRDLTAVLTGDADTSGAFTGELGLDAPDLSQLPPAWGWPRLAGRAAGRGVVAGRDPVYELDGELVARDAALAPLGIDSVRARLRIADVLGSPRVEGEASGDGLSLGGVPLGRFGLRGHASAATAAIDSFRAVRGDSAVAARAAVSFDGAGGGDYRVDELQVDLEGHRWALEEPARFAAGSDGVALAEVRVSSDLGSLRASGRYDAADDRLAGSAQLRRFDLRLLNPFVPEGWDLAGELTADVGLSGTPADPVLSAVADLRGSEFPLARIDSLHVEGSYARRRATIERLDLVTNWGRVGARGTVASPQAARLAEFWPGAELNLALTIDDADWGFVDQFRIPALARIAGRFGARLRLGGTARSPLVEGDIASAPFHVHWLHLERLDGRVEMTGERLTLADLRARQGALEAAGRIELPLRADFLAEPTTPLDGPFLMTVDIPDGTDLAPLVQACNAFAEAGGRGGMAMRVEGPLDHPAFSGWARVRGGRCVIRGLAEVYRDVDADGEWSGDWLTLTRLRGAEGLRGTFTGDGRLHFRGLMLLGFDVRLDADRFLVASIPDLRALVRGRDVHITGVKVGPDSLMVPRFTGGLEVIQARYTGDFAEKPTVSDPRQATVAPDWLADLRLVGPPRAVLISNRAMELALGGDVDLVRDESGLWLSGAMSIDAGRLPVFNNDFRVVTGRLDFTRATGVVPVVDLTAETTVRVAPEGLFVSRTLEKVTAEVVGRMDAPSVELRSESGYSRAAIERLLLGLPPHAATGPAAGGLRDASIAAGFNLLEREIAAELDVVDTVDIETQRSLATGTTHTLIGVGKYLGQDLYVKYAQGLSESERDLLIEYQINDHLLLQSEISRRLDVQQGETTYNLDLKYRVEY